MNRNHALLISLAVGIAAVAGTIAATKTIHLGGAAKAKASPATSSLVAQRSRALDRTEAALRKALAQKPPKLPPLPAATPTPAAGAPVAPAAGGQVVYRRPAPIIRTIHRPGGGHESEHEAEGGSHDGGGGGFDD